MGWTFTSSASIPGGITSSSLALHALNALLLFWLLAQATGYVGRSFAAAALFALHPVNVEAVAWVAERKTVLCMAFFLATLIAYRWYASRPNLGRYLLVALLFAMGLMSKPQVITLPFVLLLWDYWPLGRMFQSSDTSSGVMPGRMLPGKSLRWLLLEKVPLLFLSAGSAYMTMKAQWANQTLGWLEHLSIFRAPERLDRRLRRNTSSTLSGRGICRSSIRMRARRRLSGKPRSSCSCCCWRRGSR